MFLTKAVSLSEILSNYKAIFRAIQQFRAEHPKEEFLRYFVKRDYERDLAPFIDQKIDLINYLIEHPTCTLTHDQLGLIEEIHALLDEERLSLMNGNVAPVEGLTLHNRAHPLGWTKFKQAV